MLATNDAPPALVRHLSGGEGLDRNVGFCAVYTSLEIALTAPMIPFLLDLNHADPVVLAADGDETALLWRPVLAAGPDGRLDVSDVRSSAKEVEIDEPLAFLSALRFADPAERSLAEALFAHLLERVWPLLPPSQPWAALVPDRWLPELTDLFRRTAARAEAEARRPPVLTVILTPAVVVLSRVEPVALTAAARVDAATVHRFSRVGAEAPWFDQGIAAVSAVSVDDGMQRRRHAAQTMTARMIDGSGEGADFPLTLNGTVGFRLGSGAPLTILAERAAATYPLTRIHAFRWPNRVRHGLGFELVVQHGPTDPGVSLAACSLPLPDPTHPAPIYLVVLSLANRHLGHLHLLRRDPGQPDAVLLDRPVSLPLPLLMLR